MQLRFLTLNIWNGGRLWDNLESFLRQNTFDIMFFQEVFNGHGENLPKRYKTMEEFRKLFPEHFFHFAPSFGDIDSCGTFDRGNAIFSKFPITASEITFFDLPYRVFAEQKERSFEFTPRALEHCQVKIDSNVLHLFNHHGIWGNDGLDSPRRLTMGRVIADKVKSLENVILAGDFNMSPDTETIKIIEQHLKSVFGTNLISTFNMRQKDKNTGYKTAAVDMLFVSPEIRVVEKSCPDVDVSDHLPLLATLEI